MNTQRAYLVTGIAAAIFFLGMVFGWVLWHPKPPAGETYARGVVQPDSSMVLERKPQPDAVPPHQIPPRSRVERVVRTVVQPDTLVRRDTIWWRDTIAGICPPCPPVTTDLSIQRLRDGSRRAIASSPDGRVIAGVDIPVDPGVPQGPLPWSAGLAYSVDQASIQYAGACLTRDLGPVRFGGILSRAIDSRPLWRIEATACIRF